MDSSTLLVVFLSALGVGTLLILFISVLFYIKCVKPELDTMKKSPTKEKKVVSPPMPSMPFMMSNAGAAPSSPLSSSASYVTVIKRDANRFTYSGPLQQLSVVDRNIMYSISNSLTSKFPESKNHSSVSMQGVPPENIYSQVGLSQSTPGVTQRTDGARANNKTIYARIKPPPALPLREDYPRMQSTILCSSPREQNTDVQSPPSFAPREEKSRLQTPIPRTHREESICKPTPTHRIHHQQYIRMQPRTHQNEQIRRHPPTPRTPRTPLDEYTSMQVHFPFPNEVEYTCMKSPLSNPGRNHQPHVDTMDDSEIELGGSAATILGAGDRKSKVLDIEMKNFALQGGSLHRTNRSGPCKPTFTVTRSDTIPRGAVKTPINAAIEHMGAQKKLQLSRSGEDGKISHRGLARITSKPFFRSSFKGKQSCLPATSEFTFENYRSADYSFPSSAQPISPPVQSSENKHSKQSLTIKLPTESYTDESFVSSFYSGLSLNQTEDTSVAIEKVAHETIVRCDPSYASIKRSRAGTSGRACKTVETPSVNQLTLRRERITADEVDSKELNRISCLSEISCLPLSSSSDHSYTSISVPGTSIADDSTLRRTSETKISESTSLAVHDTSPVSDFEQVWMRTSSHASTIFQNTSEVPSALVSVCSGETSSNKQQHSQSNQQRMLIPSSDASDVAQKIARCKDVVRVHRKKTDDVKTSVSGHGLGPKRQEFEPVAEGHERLEPADTTAVTTTQSDCSGNNFPDAMIASSYQAGSPAPSSSSIKSMADHSGSSKSGLGSNSKVVVENDISTQIDSKDAFRNIKNTTYVTHL